MAHTPLRITIEESHAEVKYGWAQAYSPEALAQAVDSLSDQPLGYRVNVFLARLCFRGIYFPMMGKIGMAEGGLPKPSNHTQFAREAFFGRRTLPTNPEAHDAYGVVAAPDVHGEVSA